MRGASAGATLFQDDNPVVVTTEPLSGRDERLPSGLLPLQ